MIDDLNNDQDYDKPVAYDIHGKPLYAHPLSNNKTQTIHIARPTEPQKIKVSKAMMAKHKESCRLFPDLNLSKGEYVISAVKRHPIGLVIPLIIGAILIILSIIILMNLEGLSTIIAPTFGNDVAPNMIVIISMIFVFSIVASVLVVYYVYTRNRFFLTNESVIQEIQTGLFYKHEQTVSLMNIEDASFYKSGFAQQMFDYGTIRLSTEGEETTYVFSYVANPKKQIAILNNAVEAFKNGRPVSDDDD